MPKQRITREMVVEAAFALARSEGAQAVTVKALAQRLHCSVQPIYSYCQSMEGLHRALEERVAAFVQQFVAAQAQGADDLFRATGQAYLLLAEQEPHLFQLYMLRPRCPVDSIEQLYSTECDPRVAPAIAAATGLEPQAAQRLHLHLLIYTLGLGAIRCVTQPGVPLDQLQRLQQAAYDIFLQGATASPASAPKTTEPSQTENAHK